MVVPGCCNGWQAQGLDPGQDVSPANKGGKARWGLWPGRPQAVLKSGLRVCGAGQGQRGLLGTLGLDTLWAIPGFLSDLSTLFRFPSRNQLSKVFPSDIFAARLMSSSVPFMCHKAEKGDTLQLLLFSHICTFRVRKNVVKLKE